MNSDERKHLAGERPIGDESAQQQPTPTTPGGGEAQTNVTNAKDSGEPTAATADDLGKPDGQSKKESANGKAGEA